MDADLKTLRSIDAARAAPQPSPRSFPQPSPQSSPQPSSLPSSQPSPQSSSLPSSQPPVPFPAIPPAGALIAIGADITDTARIRAARERHGAPFLDRVFTADELAYCLPMPDPYPHLAARFAAKEAVAKAFATGIGAELGWHSISIQHGPRHEPLVRLDAPARALLARLGATHALITLSHTATSALAVAALVRAP